MICKCKLFSRKIQACNYDCEICRKTRHTPNMLGKFVYDDEKGVVTCTGCKNKFTQEELIKVSQNKILFV